MMTGTVCFEQKLLFVMQNLGIWGIMGTGGQNMSSKVPYFESRVPTLLNIFGKNKNLAIANRSRVSCAHNMSRASMITRDLEI